MNQRTVRISALLVAFVLPGAWVSLAPAQTVIYSTGFESNDGSYTHTGTLDQWEWGTPATLAPSASSVPRTPIAAGPSAHSGQKCWGTNLDGQIPWDVDCYLTSPAINVPALDVGQKASVSFYGWLALDEMADRGEFAVSADGTTWTVKAQLFANMQGGWSAYYFDVSSFAGGTLYLRWRCRTDDEDEFFGIPYNMAGFYVDDVAVTVSDAGACQRTLTLEAWEDQSTWASCPWLAVWNGTEYVVDNDVYSTGRLAVKEFRDYYKPAFTPVLEDGVYKLALKETEDESSYTDYVRLVTIDHAAGIEVAPDDVGGYHPYQNPSAPQSATTQDGGDVLANIAAIDDAGCDLYHNQYVVLDFSALNVSLGATLVLRAQGFQVNSDIGEGTPTGARPAIQVQTQDQNGDWVTRHTFHPRWKYATCAYDLRGDLDHSQSVRLYVLSCHTQKFEVLDYVGLDTNAPPDVTVNVIEPASAVHSVNGDVLDHMLTADNDYATMASTEMIAMTFPAPAPAGDERDFAFICEGYYVPNGTYFIYTWDGAAWVQRDGWSIAGDGDQTHTFDLSLYLPDPDGEYKVRIWQDYQYEPAGIDYVAFSCCSTPSTLTYAHNLKTDTDVLTEFTTSDDSRDEFSYPDGTAVRDRWWEVQFTGGGCVANTPPSTTPVSVGGGLTPTISWTYTDNESSAQAKYEVEVWTGPGGTGENLWDPATANGTASSVAYAGSTLTAGSTYYARVKAFDGTSWGAWGETSFICSEATTYLVTFATGEHGSLSGTTQQSVTAGGSTTAVQAVPASGYAFAGWTGSYTGTDNPLTLTNVQSNMTVTAEFSAVAPNLFVTIQPESSDGGDGSDGETPVQVGQTTSFIITVGNNGTGSATSVLVNIPLPPNFEFISAEIVDQPSADTLPAAVLDGSTVTITIPVLPNGQTVDVRLNLRAISSGSATLTAEVSSAEQPVSQSIQQPITLSAEDEYYTIVTTPGGICGAAGSLPLSMTMALMGLMAFAFRCRRR